MYRISHININIECWGEAMKGLYTSHRPLSFRFTTEEQKNFRTEATRLELKSGEKIFSADEQASKIYLIESGSVKIYRISGEGEPVTTAIRGPGDVIGVAEVLCQMNRHCMAECLEKTTVWWMDGQRFEQLLQKHVTLAVKLATVMAHRLRQAEQTIHNLIAMDVERRLVSLLIALMEKGCTPGKKGMRLNARLSHMELASMIGTCRQTVTTTLKGLSSQGLIEVGKKEIEIIDLKGLRAITE